MFALLKAIGIVAWIFHVHYVHYLHVHIQYVVALLCLVSYMYMYMCMCMYSVQSGRWERGIHVHEERSG